MLTNFTNEHMKINDDFIGRVLDAYKNGKVSKIDAINTIGHVTAAIADGNENEYTTFPKIWKPE